MVALLALVDVAPEGGGAAPCDVLERAPGLGGQVRHLAGELLDEVRKLELLTRGIRRGCLAAHGQLFVGGASRSRPSIASSGLEVSVT